MSEIFLNKKNWSIKCLDHLYFIFCSTLLFMVLVYKSDPLTHMEPKFFFFLCWPINCNIAEIMSLLVSHLETRYTWALEDISPVSSSSLSFKEPCQKLFPPGTSLRYFTSLQLDNPHSNQATLLLFIQAACSVNQSSILKWCCRDS